MRNPSIAPNRREKGVLQKNTLKQLSKHIFKSNNTTSAAGHGKPMSSNGRDAAAGTQVGYWFKSGLGMFLGSYWVCFSESIRYVTEQRLCQVKGEGRMLYKWLCAPTPCRNQGQHGSGLSTELWSTFIRVSSPQSEEKYNITPPPPPRISFWVVTGNILCGQKQTFPIQVINVIIGLKNSV